jgi:hypothetical protein
MTVIRRSQCSLVLTETRLDAHSPRRERVITRRTFSANLLQRTSARIVADGTGVAFFRQRQQGLKA